MDTSVNSPKRPSVGIGVLVWKDGKILIFKRSGSHGDGTWSIPGGHLEFGETWEECAARELQEEVGITINNIRFAAATNDIFENEAKHYVSIWLESDWADGEATSQEPDKVGELRWVTFHDLPDPLFEPCWAHIRKARPDLFA